MSTHKRAERDKSVLCKPPGWTQMAIPGTPSFFELLGMVAGDWREAASWARRKADDASHNATRMQREKLAVGYQTGIIFRDNDQAWEEIQALAETYRTYQISRRDCLKWGLVCVAGSFAPPIVNLEGTHANALQEAFDQGVKAVDIPTYIKDNRGIGALLERYRSGKSLPSSSHVFEPLEDAGVVSIPLLVDKNVNDLNSFGEFARSAQKKKTTPVATKRSTVCRYPQGTYDLEKVEILVAARLKPRLMSLVVGEEELHLGIKSVANGASNFIRLEAREL